MNRLKDFATAAVQSVLSIIKIIISSRWLISLPQQAKGQSGNELVILGNGPSLNDTIANSSDFLKSRRLLAVNFAACTDVFLQLQPRYYVLADPLFFRAFTQPNVAKLWDVISNKVDWEMTLLVPAKFQKATKGIPDLQHNTHISIAYYNTTPIEGFHWLENAAYSAQLGMPRPRNVLIPSLMLALGMGYKAIYLAGADHSWTRTLSVDDNNNVVSIQPHFYKDDEKEVKRVNTEYMHYPLHQIMYSFYVAFRSYFTIKRYANHIHATIFNITPGSFIDAFPRKKIL